MYSYRDDVMMMSHTYRGADSVHGTELDEGVSWAGRALDDGVHRQLPRVHSTLRGL